ncbi:hypothetical protein [Terrarubrum flagellatum]|uniref:hypothetical protein n=1 Tax=Terrirubrum flagellatum TaxID=2895980 RepID=UPI003144FE1C
MHQIAATRAAAWALGGEVPLLDAEEWRIDHLGRMMRFGDFLKPEAEFGWEIATIERGLLDGETGGPLIDAPVAYSLPAA